MNPNDDHYYIDDKNESEEKNPAPENKQEREKYRMPMASYIFYGLAGLVVLWFLVFMKALGIDLAKSNDSGAVAVLFVVSASSFFIIIFLVAAAQMFNIVRKIEWNTRR